MELPSIFNFAILFGVFAGLLGGSAILWAKSSPVRDIGALLFPLLIPTLIFAGLRVAQQEEPDPALFASMVVAVIGYIILTIWTTRYISGTRDASAEVKAYETLRTQYEALRTQEEAKKPLSPAKVAAKFHLPDDDRRYLVFVQGAISDILRRVVNPDVVVNSENDYMMLGRPFDKNVSGALRDMDAERDEGQRITKDALYDNLRERLSSQQLPVRLGAVFETKTAGLSAWGVKYVFHVATVQPGARGGFTLNHSQLSALFPDFVRNCFKKFSELLFAGEEISTMLFPLIGAGDGGVPALDSAKWMVKAILEQMTAYKGIRETYIVAFRNTDLQALLEAAREHNLNLDEGSGPD